MDFADRIRTLAASVPKQLEHLHTEEATKHALVMPFLQALGFNVFDPTEVIPEFTADVGTKKHEKVDYAVLKDGRPIFLIECKWHGCSLEKEQASQLFRYFSVTEARFAVLTNGIVYRFFTDLDQPNKMDARHFLEFNLLEYREQLLEELKKFTKSSFDLDNILATASELKFTSEIKKILAAESIQPSEDFVRFFVSRVYAGKMTQTVRQKFTEILRRAFHQFISERVSDRLKSALAEETTPSQTTPEVGESASQPALSSGEKKEGVETVDAEREAVAIVKAIVRRLVDPRKVVMRDAKTYCSVLFEDNNRKPICRLWFNSSQWYLGLFDENKQETRVAIKSLDDLYDHESALTATVRRYAG